MSQQRVRIGRKSASSAESQTAPTHREREHDQGLLREGHGPKSKPFESAEVQGTERRRVRESAVHSILNPFTSTPSASNYAPGIYQASTISSRPGSIDSDRLTSFGAGDGHRTYGQHHGQQKTKQVYSSQPAPSPQVYTPSDMATPRPPTVFTRRAAQAGEPTKLLSHHIGYAGTSAASQRDTRTFDPSLYEPATRMTGSFATSSVSVREQVLASEDVAPRVSQSSAYPQAHLSGSGATNLTMGVRQLVIGHADDGSSPPAVRGSYRYHTMDTEQGPVSFPLEIQTASKVADEKRRRNAGASARFRARRKEREQASSREIEDLRLQIQDLEEDVNFYRDERDYLAAQLYAVPGTSRHFPRPVSPQRHRITRPRRTTETMSVDSSGKEDTGLPYQEIGGRATQERYSRRRLSQQIHEEGASTI